MSCTVGEEMSDKPIEMIEQVTTSPNFLMIVIGAVIWILGLYTPVIFLVGPLLVVCGFGLTLIATVQAAMTKPVTSAFPGLLLGGAVQVIGYYIGWIPLVGLISPFLIVPGGVLIIFYGSSLAMQRADIPIVKDIEDFIDKRKKKEEPKESKEEVVDAEEDTSDESDASEQLGGLGGI